MEGEWNNAILKAVFLDLHAEIVKYVDALHLIDNLVSRKIVTIDDSNRITCLPGREMRCRQLMNLSHSSGNRETFVTIMESLKDSETSYDWLVKKIEEEYIMRIKESKKSTNQLVRVSHSASCSDFDRQSSITTGRAVWLPSAAVPFSSAKRPDHRIGNSFSLERSNVHTSGIEITPSTNPGDRVRHTSIDYTSASTTEQNGRSDSLGISHPSSIQKLETVDGIVPIQPETSGSKRRPQSATVTRSESAAGYNVSVLDGMSYISARGTSGIVAGMALLNDRLYVVCMMQNFIEIYSAVNDEYNSQQKISVVGLKEPSDIVACNSTIQVYVADIVAKSVFVLSADGQFIRRERIDRPLKLSVRAGRLLVTHNDKPKLTLYDREMKVVTQISLEKMQMQVQHAVESIRGTFFVAFSSWTAGAPGRLCEINVEGHALAVFDDSRWLKIPRYIALGNHSKLIYIADSGNNRMIVVSWEKKEAGVVVDCVAEPRRICLLQNDQFLLCESNNDFFSRYGHCSRRKLCEHYSVKPTRLHSRPGLSLNYTSKSEDLVS